MSRAASNRFFLNARARRFSRNLFATKFRDCRPFHSAASLSAAAARVGSSFLVDRLWIVVDPVFNLRPRVSG